MKRLATTVSLLVAAGVLVASAAFAGAVRISQVYGGGGAASGTPTYNVDYVELFNFSALPQNIGGWAVMYGSSAGNFGSSASNVFTFPPGATIQPCSWVLISLGTPSAAGANLPVTADYFGTLAMSATNGKVALLTTGVPANLVCAGNTAGGDYVDVVGYGTATCYEGAATAALTNASGAVRNSTGMDDTQSNVADFTIVNNPVPRNSATAPSIDCQVTPTRQGTWGAIKQIYR